jgi:Skp family chaperone for outer membrane proteins
MNLGPKSVLVALLLLGVTALTLGQAGGAAAASRAAPAATTPPPTKLAVVNIVNLFAGLREKEVGDADIDKMRADFETQGLKLKKEMEDLDKQLPALAVGSEDFQKVQDTLLKKTMEYQSFGNFAQQKIFIELSVRTKAIYRKINDAVAKYAAANGIALVFVADNSNMEKADTQEKLMGMITTRKVLYFHPDFDITNTIKQMMNTEYNLGNSGKTGG